MKHRCRLDIFAAMLRAAEEETLKTRIMHLAFVSSNQMQEYLDLLLLEGGLIAVRNGSSYQTTEKGKHFLTIYQELEDTVFWKNASGQIKQVAE
jgi:predicted transcriptional regulator